MIIERLGLDRDSFVVELASNDGYLLQYFVKREIPCLGIEPAANVAKAARERGVPTTVAFFDETLGQRAGRRAASRPISCSATTFSRRCPTSTRSSPASPPAEADRHGDHRVPAPDAAVRREPVRHHLPRALLLLLAARRRGDLRRARHDDLRRRGAVDARRLAAHLRPSDRRHEPPGQRPSARAAPAKRPPATASSRRTRASRSRSARRSASCSSCSSELKRDGKHDRRLRRAGQGQHAAQLLRRSAPTSSTSPSTATRTSRAGSCRARTSRSCAPERIDEVKPDYIFILPWNLKDEILAQLAHARDWGARFIVPIPEPVVL